LVSIRDFSLFNIISYLLYLQFAIYNLNFEIEYVSPSVSNSSISLGIMMAITLHPVNPIIYSNFG